MADQGAKGGRHRRGDSFHRYLMDHVADPWYLHDETGQIHEVNQAACRHTGYSRDELVRMKVYDLNPTRDPAEVRNMLASLAPSLGGRKIVHGWQRHRNGQWMEVEVHLVRLPQKEPIRFLASIRDASERVRLNQELQQKIAFDELLLDFSTRLINIPPDEIDQVIHQVLADIGHFFNAGRTYLFDIDSESRTFSNTHEWSAQGVEPEIERLQNLRFEDFPWVMGHVLEGQVAYFSDLTELGEEYRQERAEFEYESIQSLVVVPIFKEGKPQGLLGLDTVRERRYWSEDIRNNLRLLGQLLASAMDAVQLGNELQYLAYHDSLTGLPNRKLLRDRIEHAIAECSRKSSELAIMLLDLDDFKLINDSLSHSVGDTFLAYIAERLRRVCRSGDTVGRLGGDEFVLVMEVTEAADAARAAERALEVVGEVVNIDGANLLSHSSIGISLYPHDAEDHDSLIRRADLAMYEAKSAGKNRFAFFDEEMTQRAQASLELRHDLDLALRRDELQLHFQPRVDLRAWRVCGLEALVRWEHPDRGLLHPDQFLPLAERSGMICRIDHWVLEKARREAERWQGHDGDLRISVNLSARDLYEAEYFERLLEILVAPGSGAALPLEIEITESTLMYNMERAIENLERIKAAAPGVRIAIDDFGSGYSSLNYLRRIPMDTLKIDQAFIHDLYTPSRGARAIVRSIVDLARNLELHVVAEGVETESQLEVLKGLGVAEIQGFLFGPPAPLEEVRKRGLRPVKHASPLYRGKRRI